MIKPINLIELTDRDLISKLQLSLGFQEITGMVDSETINSYIAWKSFNFPELSNQPTVLDDFLLKALIGEQYENEQFPEEVEIEAISESEPELFPEEVVTALELQEENRLKFLLDKLERESERERLTEFAKSKSNLNWIGHSNYKRLCDTIILNGKLPASF